MFYTFFFVLRLLLLFCVNSCARCKRMLLNFFIFIVQEAFFIA